MSLWTLVLLTIAGCYAFKLAGYLVPERVLGRPLVRKLVELLPVALLAALVVVEAVASGHHWLFDGPRLAGFAVGALATWRRAPFIVIIVAAAATAALFRLAT
jgi:branched-subunit amino acid transport protein